MAKKRNDSEWRAECIATYGNQCASCGTGYWIQMDHIMPRSQQGDSVVPNGLPLCRDCHERKTNSQLQIRPGWLTRQQREYLRDKAWVFWGEDGTPYGRGFRHFTNDDEGVTSEEA